MTHLLVLQLAVIGKFAPEQTMYTSGRANIYYQKAAILYIYNLGF